LLADWIWGGGWLAELGTGIRLGHGLVDIGGGAVVPKRRAFSRWSLRSSWDHATAGLAAQDLRCHSGHNLPYVILGSINPADFMDGGQARQHGTYFRWHVVERGAGGHRHASRRERGSHRVLHPGSVAETASRAGPGFAEDCSAAR